MMRRSEVRGMLIGLFHGVLVGDCDPQIVSCDPQIVSCDSQIVSCADLNLNLRRVMFGVH